MSERPELIAEVAGQFERLEVPLRLGAATLDDAQAVSQRIALVLRGYLALPPRDRIAFVSQGIFLRQPEQIAQVGEKPKGKS